MMVQFIKFIDYNDNQKTINLNHVVEFTSEKKNETSLLVDIIGEYIKADGERIAPTQTIGACYEYICYQINFANPSARFINVDCKYKEPNDQKNLYAEKYIEIMDYPGDKNIELRHILETEYSNEQKWILIRLTCEEKSYIKGVSPEQYSVFCDKLKKLKVSDKGKAIKKYEGTWMFVGIDGRYS